MEALRRDPGDSRSNLALARRRCAQGQFAQAQAYAAASLARQTAHNANPYDGEASYMLGLTQRLQGRPDEAYDAFAKAAWNAAWQDAACFELARLDARRGDYPAALEHLERALSRNANHHQGRHLQAAVLRAMGRLPEARQAARLGLQRNPFNHGCWWELTGPLAALDASAASAPPAPPQASAPSTPATASQGGDSSANPSLPPFAADGSDSASFGAAGTWPELALDYAHAGFYDEAAAVLRRAAPTALNAYLLGWVQAQAGELSAAQHAWQAAAALSPDYGFPNRLEEVLALQQAVAANPADAHAHYMLGNFWYAHRQYDQAISAWEACAALAPGFAPALRNLGLAAFNHQHDAAAALAYFRRAFELAPHHARLLFELDQLEKRLGVDAQARLDRLNQFDQLTVQRDDLSLERVALLNTLGRPEDAYRMLMSRRFHPWEGGEGKTTRQYVAALAEMARRRLDAGRYRAALDLLEQARHYPYSLGEGKLLGVRENHLDYLAGLAWRQVGDETQARGYFERAAAGDYALASAMFYNDQPPEMIYYQGLAQRALGDEAAARRTFQRLVDYAQLHIDDEVKIDYFAVSLPDFLVFEDDLKARNRALCAHLLALGRQGLAGA